MCYFIALYSRVTTKCSMLVEKQMHFPLPAPSCCCTAATSSSGKVMIYLLRPREENLIKSDCLSLEGNLDWYTAHSKAYYDSYG